MFYRQHHLACGCYCTRALSLLFLDADNKHMIHQAVSFFKSSNENYIFVYCRLAFSSLPNIPNWFLWTEYKHLHCLSPSVSRSLPPQQMRVMEVLIVCILGIDYSAGGQEWCLHPWELYPYELCCIIFCIKHARCPLWHIKSAMTALWS